MIWLVIFVAFVWVAPPVFDLFSDQYPAKRQRRLVSAERKGERRLSGVAVSE
jgi:hypothetical protein